LGEKKVEKKSPFLARPKKKGSKKSREKNKTLKKKKNFARRRMSVGETRERKPPRDTQRKELPNKETTEPFEESWIKPKEKGDRIKLSLKGEEPKKMIGKKKWKKSNEKPLRLA